MRTAALFVTLSIFCVGTPSAQERLTAADRARYREAAIACVDKILEHGLDRYGPVKTAMIASVIDTRTGEVPQEPEPIDSLIRTEGRFHRRNPGGADLWDDQHLLRVLYAASELSGDDTYTKASDVYVAAFLERGVKDNGLLSWGSHIYYDLYTDAPGGDQDGKGPHETLVLCPDWKTLWRINPKAVQREIEGMWEWHVVDKETGLFNRHDDKHVGCDFAFLGGELIYAFAFLANETGDEKYLDWAKIVAGRHWNARNTDTNLTPDAPSTGDRYDANHCFTTIPGPYAASLLKAYEVSGEVSFRDMALAHIEAYTRYGWDADAQRYHAMLTLDGAPVPEEERGSDYDRFKPTGHVETWRTLMYSYEFPLIAAQTAVYAFEVTNDPDAHVAARNWATHIRQDMPVQLGHRWKADVEETMPALKNVEGSYAENYGRAISFFLAVHRATGDLSYLRDAKSIADDALQKLSKDGWIVGLPTKPLYETVDGVPILLHALLELSAYPDQLAVNL